MATAPWSATHRGAPAASRFIKAAPPGLPVTGYWGAVARHREAGINLINDGEYGHSIGIEVQLTIFPTDVVCTAW
jgi:hypothetical protein